MPNGRMLLPDARLPSAQPLSYGLLSTATELTGLDRHWNAGLTWQANCPEAATTYDECLVLDANGVPVVVEPIPKAQQDDQEIALRGAVPFTVFAEVDCNPIGSWERGQDWARESLVRDEGRQVERAFALGLTTAGPQVVWPNLSGVAAAPTTPVIDDSGVLMQPPVVDVTPAAPTDIVHALYLLEEALAECYAGQGFIHVPRGFGALLSAWHLVEVFDGGLVTKAGNKVVLGVGYPGNAPGAGVIDPDRYMYATGQVFYARGDIQTKNNTESLDRSVNTLHAIAERTYVIGWDCCLLAVAVDTTLSGAGGS